MTLFCNIFILREALLCRTKKSRRLLDICLVNKQTNKQNQHKVVCWIQLPSHEFKLNFKAVVFYNKVKDWISLASVNWPTIYRPLTCNYNQLTQQMKHSSSVALRAANLKHTAGWLTNTSQQTEWQTEQTLVSGRQLCEHTYTACRRRQQVVWHWVWCNRRQNVQFCLEFL